MVTRADEPVRAASYAAASKGVPGKGAEIHYCDACGAEVMVAAEAWKLPPDWGSILLCGRCALALPAEEVDRLARELALRGVPLS